MVQVRRLLDMLPILPRRKDERRFGELPFAQPAALCVLLGELQGVQGPVVEQHKPILPCLRPFLNYPERNRSPHVGCLLGRIDRIPSQCQAFGQA
ncbi:hypothetical protein D3C72_1295160 [compost metagenome]